MEELEKSMYYGAKPDTLSAAKILRNNMTSYEKLLWERLKLKQVCGIRFRRQHPIENIIDDVIKIIENEVKTRTQSPPWGI